VVYSQDREGEVVVVVMNMTISAGPLHSHILRVVDLRMLHRYPYLHVLRAADSDRANPDAGDTDH